MATFNKIGSFKVDAFHRCELGLHFSGISDITMLQLKLEAR